jgi:hypothetical protein
MKKLNAIAFRVTHVKTRGAITMRSRGRFQRYPRRDQVLRPLLHMLTTVQRHSKMIQPRFRFRGRPDVERQAVFAP